MGPIELDTVGEDLEVILDFLRSRASRSKEDQASRNEEDDRGDVQVVGRVAKACEESPSMVVPCGPVAFEHARL